MDEVEVHDLHAVLGLRLQDMIALGLGPVGMVVLGTGAEAFGPARATAVMGAIAVAMVIIILIAIPSLRRVETTLEDQFPAPVEEQEPSATPSA